MTEYKASNGMVVERDHNGDVVIDRQTNHVSLFMADGTALALREYFQAERDNELGRWRWPANPDYVVYSDPDEGAAIVGCESMPAGVEFVWREDCDGAGDIERAARAFFDAHPEPKKPWEDAKEGEVWALTFRDKESSWFVNGHYFQNTRTFTNILPNDKSITAGRRLFPTEATK